MTLNQFSVVYLALGFALALQGMGRLYRCMQRINCVDPNPYAGMTKQRADRAKKRDEELRSITEEVHGLVGGDSPTAAAALITALVVVTLSLVAILWPAVLIRFVIKRKSQ